jgi:hypothetical protein
MENNYKKHIDLYIECINQERYFDAHEALEHIWFPRRFENSNEIKLLKGFINAAVSFELIKRGRITQSKRVWQNYLKYKKLLPKIDSVNTKQYHLLSSFVERTSKRLHTKSIRIV